VEEGFVVHVVDDDEPVRDSIGLLLDTVGIQHKSYASAQEFLDRIAEGVNKELDNAAGSELGVLILDIRMPGMSGLDLQQKLQELGIRIPIVFVTGHGDVPMAVEAMKRGAVDFIRKPFREQELLNRINEARHLGEQRRVEGQLLEEAQKRVAELTPRESEVFFRVAQGQANKVVAIDLGISERTVEIHRSQAMKKTGSRTLADLVRLKLILDQAD